MKTVQNTLNYQAKAGRNFELPSLTVPDQSMSVNELLKRHASGIHTAGNQNPFFDEDSQGLDIRKLDLVDLQQLTELTKARVTELKEKAANELKEAKNAKQKASAEARKQMAEEIQAELSKKLDSKQQ